MSAEVRPEFRAALHDFRWLLERHYPERPSVALVGDRYRLSRSERAILYRGVCTGSRAAFRAGRLIGEERKRLKLVVDGYNVLFTVVHYVQGKKLFRSMDRFIRDTGSGSGRVSRWALFEEAAAQVVRFLGSVGAAGASVYLDHRMTRSRDHITALRRMADAEGLAAEWYLVDAADQVLREECREGTALVTADSELIDKTRVPLIDGGGEIVTHQFGGTVLDLTALVEE
jgi:hypothetical protein